MAGRTPSLIACVLLSPWPLELLQRRHPGVPVAVLSEEGSGGGRRVLHVSPGARDAGVKVGMRDTAALSRCPELHAETMNAPLAAAAWNELLEQMYVRYSDRVEGRTPGLIFLKLSLGAARDLAAALQAPVGLAGSLEVAHLAALRAKAGEVREVHPGEQAEQAFLNLVPLEHLQVLGLSPAQAERLRFLGVTGLADLCKWSAAQREAFLGVDMGTQVNRFLKGHRTEQLPRYVPGQILEASLDTDAPLLNSLEADAAFQELLPGLMTGLRGRTAAYLTVRCDTLGGSLTATRKLKWPLDSGGLMRVAGLALEDTGALAIGIDRLSVQFSGLQQPSRMVGLWAGLADLDVTRNVLDRFPDALVRVRWLDPWAYTTNAMYEWVDWQTGEVRPTPMTPQMTWTPTRAQAREKAVDRILAFFEGAQP
ncbi:Y-family DNA polymerase [Deinococcus deserti]|uniref:Putative Y-family DNA polymerase n=1 Tax=Deinococcus deserti (strain DSM 17065 / CIP 109153 / LMG 22923 / VCD115) TaxID=546414 RepID=C1D2K9_DEIDV|nr:Y-family DNA polymerase [Deinococcus deserti]ACO47648.1 putative Y-family DNA polymerase [Deinococcus deserti VCD115]